MRPIERARAPFGGRRTVRLALAVTGLTTGMALPGYPDGRPVCPSNATSRTEPSPSCEADIRAAYGRLPLGFEANQGQTDPRVRYLARGSGYTLFLAGTEAVLAFRGRGTSFLPALLER